MPHLSAGDVVTARELVDGELQAAPGIIAGDVHGRWPWTVRTHSSIARAVKVFGLELLNYKIVSMARNPWDRAVSEFYWAYRERDIRKLSFEERARHFRNFLETNATLTKPRKFIDWMEGRQRNSKFDQAELATIDGIFIADRVIFYEELEGSLAEVSDFLGLDEPLRLPPQRQKGNIRPKSSAQSWRSFYDDHLIDLVAVACQSEISLFGYAFDGASRPAFSGVRQKLDC